MHCICRTGTLFLHIHSSGRTMKKQCYSISAMHYLNSWNQAKLFKWIYFWLQSIWLAYLKCRPKEIDDPLSEFIIVILHSCAIHNANRWAITIVIDRSMCVVDENQRHSVADIKQSNLKLWITTNLADV